MATRGRKSSRGGSEDAFYRARDTKLNRDVAMKVLPDAFTVDGDRIARFRGEAQVLASLNHPNIAAIYGFEDSGGTHALVLELVEGQTPADRIGKGRNVPPLGRSSHLLGSSLALRLTFA
jgi:serine/threonine-protein kinase